MKVAIFILAILTNEGELQLHSKELPECPDKLVVTETLDKKKESGEIIEWNAICLHPQVDAKVEGND
jgi:hypothetical protein